MTRLESGEGTRDSPRMRVDGKHLVRRHVTRLESSEATCDSPRIHVRHVTCGCDMSPYVTDVT